MRKKVETVTDFTFLGSKITVDGDWSHDIKRHLFIERKAMTNLHSILQSRDIILLTKVGSSQSCCFSSSHVQMLELDHKEGWGPKNRCFRIVVLEKTLESPLDSKESKPVNPKGNQSWIFIRRSDAEVEAPILWLPDAKSRLTGKDCDAGKDWGHKEKGVTEDEMVRLHHQLNGHKSEQIPDIVKDRETWHAVVHEAAKHWTQLNDWTIATNIINLILVLTFHDVHA